MSRLSISRFVQSSSENSPFSVTPMRTQFLVLRILERVNHIDRSEQPFSQCDSKMLEGLEPLDSSLSFIDLPELFVNFMIVHAHTSQPNYRIDTLSGVPDRPNANWKDPNAGTTQVRYNDGDVGVMYVWARLVGLRDGKIFLQEIRDPINKAKCSTVKRVMCPSFGAAVGEL